MQKRKEMAIKMVTTKKNQLNTKWRNRGTKTMPDIQQTKGKWQKQIFINSH
jgi:hypothetical protein